MVFLYVLTAYEKRLALDPTLLEKPRDSQHLLKAHFVPASWSSILVGAQASFGRVLIVAH